MKLIKKLLDRLHQLIGKLHDAVTKLEDKNEEVRQDKLYKLRLDRGLSMLGIPPIKMGPGHIRFTNFVHNNMPRKDALWQTLTAEAANIKGEVSKGFDGVQTRTVSGKTEEAYKEAMKVTLPTLKEKAKVKAKSVSDGTKRTYNRVQQKFQGKGSVIKRVFFTLLRLLAILFVVALLLWGLFALYSYVKNRNTPTSDSPKAPVEQVCSTWKMVELPDNNGTDRYFADGLEVIKKAKYTRDGATTMESKDVAISVLKSYGDKREYLIVFAGENLTEDQWKTVKIDEISKAGECANEATVNLYNMVSNRILEPTTKVTIEDAPSNWTNSGNNGGRVVIDATPGITGERKALIIRYGDGIETGVLARCGNIVKKSFRHHDKGKTDEHKHHHDKPKCEGNECLTPKSSNPKDYKKPGDGNEKDSGKGTKPKVTETKPADKAAPVVETSKPGGGGVVDTPTNKPGSETGVTAPDAKPAPKVETPKPKNEGGTPVNDGVVTD
jgi:hypothetical protein